MSDESYIQTIYEKVVNSFNQKSQELTNKLETYHKKLEILKQKVAFAISNNCQKQYERVIFLEEGPSEEEMKQIEEGTYINAEISEKARNTDVFQFFQKLYNPETAKQAEYELYREVYGDERLNDEDFDDGSDILGPIPGEIDLAIVEDLQMCVERTDIQSFGIAELVDQSDKQFDQVDFENLECLDECDAKYEMDGNMFEECATTCITNSLSKLNTLIDEFDKRASLIEAKVAHININLI
jgi:hypothetical protein